MKSTFRPLGIAAAVSAVVAGYAGVVSAQSTAIGELGDLGIIPYYTVADGFVTGVHIINSSAATQVVKLRLRRGSDSADALDFNLIMSPKDEWTGFIDDSSGALSFSTEDNTCTAPIRADGVFPMPAIFRAGADEGYIEVIGMGQPINEQQPIAVAAKHKSDGVPVNCTAVASNFFANGVAGTKKGIVSNEASVQQNANGTFSNNSYADADNVLKVSYFFRDAGSGTEMGGNAVHIADFSADPWMTNQEFGLFSGDVKGFDYPDLDGGPLTGAIGTPASYNLRGKYNSLRNGAVLGVSKVLNDWSVAAARNVSTDWVVTMPGQYTMIDYYVWAAAAGLDFEKCAQLDNPSLAGDQSVAACDFRDIPVSASLTLYDREEGTILPEDGDLVISPAPPGTQNVLTFPYEVNVVNWTDGTTAPALGQSDYATTIDPTPLGEFGWAELAVSSTSSWDQYVCQFFPVPPTTWSPTTLTPRPAIAPLCVSATGNVPVVGFVAWERSFPSNPDASYGRLIDHSYVSGGSTGP